MNGASLETTRRIVFPGRVHCPSRRAGVSVEECWMCESLRGFDVDGETEFVRCSLEPKEKEAGPSTGLLSVVL